MSFSVSYNFIANDQFSSVAKRIKKSTRNIGKSIAVVSNKFKSINTSQKKTGKALAVISNKLKVADASFKKTGKAIAILPKKLIPVNTSLKKTGKELAIIPNKLAPVNSSFKRTGTELVSLSSKFKRFDAQFKRGFKGTQIPRVNRSIISSFKKMLSVGKRVFAGMGESVLRFIKKLKRMKRIARGAGAGVGSGLRNLVVGAGIFLGIKKAITVGADFQTSIADVSAITGIAGPALLKYRDQILEVSKASITSQNSTAEAFALIASGKSEILKTKGALRELVEQSLLLANASGVDVPVAVKATVGALNQFGQGADQASRFVNVLAAGAKVGASLVGETVLALKNVGKVAGEFGASFEETNSLIQVLARSELRGAEAGTQLKSVFAVLEEKLTKMGGRFAKMRPSVAGLTKTLEFLRDENLSVTDSLLLFGREVVNAGLILIKDIDLVKQWTKEITGTAVAMEQAKKRLNTFNKKMELVGIIIGDKLIKVFDKLEPTLSKLTVEFGEWIDSLTPKQIDAFAKEIEGFIRTAVSFGKQLFAAFKDDDGKVSEFRQDLENIGTILGGLVKFGGAIGKTFKVIGTFIGETIAKGVLAVEKIIFLAKKALSFLGIGDDEPKAPKAPKIPLDPDRFNVPKVGGSDFATATKGLFPATNIIPNIIPDIRPNIIPDIRPKIALDPIGDAVLDSLTKGLLPINLFPDTNVIPINNKIIIQQPDNVRSEFSVALQKTITPEIKLAQPENVALPPPPTSPTVTNIQDAKATVDINIQAPRGVVKDVKVDDVKSGKRLNVAFNMKEAAE